jgi:hypothetical protein
MPNAKKKTALRQVEPENLSANSAVRRIVFISHSNPEGNDFTTWLAARLALGGSCHAAPLEVWVDIQAVNMAVGRKVGETADAIFYFGDPCRLALASMPEFLLIYGVGRPCSYLRRVVIARRNAPHGSSEEAN